MKAHGLAFVERSFFQIGTSVTDLEHISSPALVVLHTRQAVD